MANLGSRKEMNPVTRGQDSGTPINLLEIEKETFVEFADFA